MNCYTCGKHMFATELDQIRYCLNTNCNLYLVEFERIIDIINKNADDFNEEDWNFSDQDRFEDDL